MHTAFVCSVACYYHVYLRINSTSAPVSWYNASTGMRTPAYQGRSQHMKTGTNVRVCWYQARLTVPRSALPRRRFHSAVRTLAYSTSSIHGISTGLHMIKSRTNKKRHAKYSLLFDLAKSNLRCLCVFHDGVCVACLLVHVCVWC